MYTHTLRHSGTRTRMLLPAPEQCRICLPRIHVFDSSKCLRRYTNTHTHTRIHACWFTHTNCTRQRLRAHTRMTSCMHAPNLRFRFKEMEADAYMCALTHAHPHKKHAVAGDVAVHNYHTRTHTHTHSCNKMSFVSSAQKIFRFWGTTASLYN